MARRKKLGPWGPRRLDALHFAKSCGSFSPNSDQAAASALMHVPDTLSRNPLRADGLHLFVPAFKPTPPPPPRRSKIGNYQKTRRRPDTPRTYGGYVRVQLPDSVQEEGNAGFGRWQRQPSGVPFD